MPTRRPAASLISRERWAPSGQCHRLVRASVRVFGCAPRARHRWPPPRFDCPMVLTAPNRDHVDERLACSDLSQRAPCPRWRSTTPQPPIRQRPRGYESSPLGAPRRTDSRSAKFSRLQRLSTKRPERWKLISGHPSSMCAVQGAPEPMRNKCRTALPA